MTFYLAVWFHCSDVRQGRKGQKIDLVFLALRNCYVSRALFKSISCRCDLYRMSLQPTENECFPNPEILE